MSNKKNRPDVLSNGRSIVGTESKTVETPKGVVKNPSSVPGTDGTTHAFVKGAGKRRFDRSEK